MAYEYATLPVAARHPHACGEQAKGNLQPGDLLGPSPRVRGAVDFHAPPVAVIGTIPARAGSSVGIHA